MISAILLRKSLLGVSSAAHFCLPMNYYKSVPLWNSPTDDAASDEARYDSRAAQKRAQDNAQNHLGRFPAVVSKRLLELLCPLVVPHSAPFHPLPHHHPLGPDICSWATMGVGADGENGSVSEFLPGPRGTRPNRRARKQWRQHTPTHFSERRSCCSKGRGGEREMRP